MSDKRHPYTVRLTKPQTRLVADLASRLGLPEYQARLRIFEHGLAAASGNQENLQGEATLNLLAEILARLDSLERLTDRVLFTAASAYAFAAHTAHRGSNNSSQLNETLSEAAMAAYRRQLEAARSQT